MKQWHIFVLHIVRVSDEQIAAVDISVELRLLYSDNIFRNSIEEAAPNWVSTCFKILFVLSHFLHSNIEQRKCFDKSRAHIHNFDNI